MGQIDVVTEKVFESEASGPRHWLEIQFNHTSARSDEGGVNEIQAPVNRNKGESVKVGRRYVYQGRCVSHPTGSLPLY